MKIIIYSQVIYTGEGKNKIMSHDDVTQHWTSLDRTRILLMCQDFAQSTGMEPVTIIVKHLNLLIYCKIFKLNVLMA